MPRDDEKLLRQLSLVSLLLSRGRPVTTREIRESVEGYGLMTDDAFTRRFYGDREDLGTLGIQIRQVDDPDEPGSSAFYLTGEDYYLPDVEFTSEELRSLAVALAVLEGRFAYARPLRLALAALTGGHPDPLQEDLDRVAVRLASDEEGQTADRFARFEDALTRGKTVVFDYRTASGDVGRRRVDPYGLFRIGGHWYVVGHDHDREAERTFRLSRVSGPVQFATKNPRDFRIPADFDPSVHRARPPWLLGAPVGQAEILIDDDLTWWVQRSYPQLDVRPCAPPVAHSTEGTALLTTPYADANALVCWVLGLGRRAELRAPAELRAELVGRLDSVLEAHRDGR